MWHKHKWTRWLDGGLVHYYISGHVGEQAYRDCMRLVQNRECKDCGKKQRREVR